MPSACAADSVACVGMYIVYVLSDIAVSLNVVEKVISCDDVLIEIIWFNLLYIITIKFSLIPVAVPEYVY